MRAVSVSSSLNMCVPGSKPYLSTNCPNHITFSQLVKYSNYRVIKLYVGNKSIALRQAKQCTETYFVGTKHLLSFLKYHFSSVST
jgi:hypothetical protein